jgi:hypothetical protein
MSDGGTGQCGSHGIPTPHRIRCQIGISLLLPAPSMALASLATRVRTVEEEYTCMKIEALRCQYLPLPATIGGIVIVRRIFCNVGGR